MMAGEGEGRNWEEVAEQADKVVSSVDLADTRENQSINQFIPYNTEKYQ